MFFFLFLIFQVYDKWKLENDQKLKAKLRKQREVERKCQLEKQEVKEDRKRDSKYAFTSWWVENDNFVLILYLICRLNKNSRLY